MTGQTLAEFIKRKRLERALLKMAHAPRMKLTQVALECGFNSSADFSRSFKQHFGAAPSAFDITKWQQEHAHELESRTIALSGAQPISNDDFKVKIRSLPPRTVAYIRVENPYGGTGVVDACNRLVAWAERHGFADGQWLGYQWENPELVALENCAYYVAVEADRFKPEGDIGRFRFPAMTIAQVDLRGDIQLELRALQWLYGEWLPKSGYVPDDQPGFEAWVGRPFAHGYEYFELAAQIPLRKFS